ncbi:MAG: CpsD/CapB family tyrosine-protein kinase, partial [Methylococcaceae bacterium]
SLVCANLAIALALEGNQTVLLVDLDFRQPRLAHYLGLPPTHGLSDYLAGDVAFEHILFNPGIEGLVVVPAGTVGLYPTEWAATRRLAELILEIKTRYESRILLFDIPPLSHADAAQLLLPKVDGAVLIVEDGRHSPDELHHAMHLLEGTPLLGLVLNQTGHQAGLK